MPCNPRATRGYGLLEGLLARQRMRRAEKLIDPAHRTGRLLDFGCGRFPLFLSRARFHDKYGLDQHIDESARFEGLDTNVTLKRFDIDKQDRLPFDDDYFNVVTMLAVFEHLKTERLVILLSEFARVLSPGGQFIMTTPARWAEPVLDVLTRLRLVSAEEIHDHETCYNRRGIRRLIDATDLAGGEYRDGSFELGMNLWVTVRR